MESNKSYVPDRIQYHYQIDDFVLPNEKITTDWVEKIVRSSAKSLSYIEYIFATDEEVLKVNQKYLNHDDYTDIITFCLQEDPLEATIYISVERVRDNAQTYQTTFNKELYRVIIHGVLHLLGYKDKTAQEAQEMRSAEERCLKLLGY